MPNCSNCGYALNETDKYCGACGKPQFEIVYANGIRPFQFPSKPSTNFYNGFMMGVGAISVVAGLIWWSWLNNNFWQTQERLMAMGWSLKEINYFLLDNVFLISFCVFAIILGSYLLVSTSLMQFSPTINSLLRGSINRARWGFGLIVGGMISFGDGITDFVRSMYRQDLYIYSTPYFIVAGILLVLVGSLLIANAYTRSRKSVTKV